jgi:hypothetical protein
VPTSCLRCINTVPQALRAALPPDMSVHGLLAADMALEAAAVREKPSKKTRKEKQEGDDTNATTATSSSSLLLDCYLTPSPYAPWNAVLPTPADLTSMPLVWPPALQVLLPGPAAKLLAAQQAKLARDWAAVRDAGILPDSGDTTPADGEVPQTYRHAWLLVNTRTFYYEAPLPTATTPSTTAGAATPRRRPGANTKRQQPPPPPQQQQQQAGKRASNTDDNMALQPVADLFNHDGAAGCGVAFDAASFVVKAARAHAAGDEARIRYGRHGGDFLAVEYGFVPDGGDEWDEVGLDEVILPRLQRGGEEEEEEERPGEGGGVDEKARKRKRKDSSCNSNNNNKAPTDAGQKAAAERRQQRAARWRDRLEERGFLGGYVLDQRTVCYRTQVALRALLALEKAEERDEKEQKGEKKKKQKKEGADGNDDDDDGCDAWSRFVDGLDDGDAEQPAADALLAGLLEAYRAGAVAERIRRVEKRGGDLRAVGESCQRDLLVARWRQADRLLELTIERLRDPEAGKE